MKEEILQQKIRGELENLPINTEARVLYFLVEVRKVLEHDNVPNNILRFYGDWVVHTKLDRKFAQKVYEFVNKEDRAGQDIISFTSLKTALRDFLESNEMPTDLTEIETNWTAFREKLIDILVDTPIVRKQEEVVGTFAFQRRNGKGIEFQVKNKDGEVLGRMFV